MQSTQVYLNGLIDPYAVVSNQFRPHAATHHLNVAVMVSYNPTLCDISGDEVYGKFFGEPNSSPHGVRGAEQPPVSVASSSVGVFQ